MPKDLANRDYWANNMNSAIDKLDLPYRNPEVIQALAKVSERHMGQNKNYNRNQAHVCSFFVQGKCNRGKACPYRHENITDEDLKAMQKGQGKVEDRIKDRFNGVNDPLAEKIASKMKDFKVPESPEDQNITTLFIGGITDQTDQHILEQQFSPFGKLSATRMIPSKQCAFISFLNRQDCEKAFSTLYERLFYPDQKKKLKLLWAKQQLDPSSIKKKKINKIQKEQKDQNEEVIKTQGEKEE